MSELEKAARSLYDFHCAKVEEFDGYKRNSKGQSANTMNYYNDYSNMHRNHATTIAEICKLCGFGKDWLK